MVIVHTRVKELIGEMSVAKDFYEALEKKVTEMIATAVERAKANKRRTVMGKDV